TKNDREIRFFLGDANFLEFEKYNRQREEAAVLIRINRLVGNSPDALTADQASRLQELLRQQPDARLSPLMIRAASGFLSMPQVQALEAALETQAETRRQRHRQALPPRPVQ
ncbi:MAG: hypothetical protein ABIR80_14225, partial [Opitutaceae bacterium]